MFFSASSGLGSVPRLRELDARLDQLGDLAVQLLELLVRELQLGAQLVDRVLRLAETLQVLLRAVDLRVADVVAGEAVRLGDEEHRTAAGPRMLDRLRGGLVDLADVLPVDLHRLHPVRLGALGHVLDRHVLLGRRRLGPVVVLADEHGRDIPELRKVERLVEGADVRRPVAEERDRDARLVTELERECGADDRGQPTADDGVRSEIPALDVVEVHRSAVAVRAALELPVQLRHQLVRVRALREGVPVRAVSGGDDVAFLERSTDADSDCFLADRHMEESRQLACSEALFDLFLEAPDEQHLAEELAQQLGRDRPLPLHLGHGRQCSSGH